MYIYYYSMFILSMYITNSISIMIIMYTEDTKTAIVGMRKVT